MPAGSQDTHEAIEAARNTLREVRVMTSSMIDQPEEYFTKCDHK